MSQTISVFLVDDESLARERLKRLLQDEPRYTIAGEADDGESAIEKITQLRPDLVILDIRMPGIDGLEVAEYISTMTPSPSIVFCTAYDEYAVKAFTFNAIGYLLKPIRKEDLKSALEKASRLSQAQLKKLKEDQLSREQPDSFVANTWQGMEKLDFSDIFYFRADHKYVTIFHKGGETLSDQTLKQIESSYGDQVLRTHRNTLVNKYHIRAIHRHTNGQYQLELSERHEVPVSRRLVSEVKQALSEL